MRPHPLTNFEIQKYYQNEPRFNAVYSRDNLPKIKDGAYIIKFWRVLWYWNSLGCFANNDDVTYFDSFGVEHIPKENKAFINNKNLTTNIFRIQAYDSIVCGYFCVGFIDFMLAGKRFTDSTNLFSPYDFKKNELFGICVMIGWGKDVY